MGAPQKFNAQINVVVIVPIGYDYDTNLLERQVRLADQASPWKSSYEGGNPAPSIGWKSDITMKEGAWIDRQYSLSIRPCFKLTWEQGYAYGQYGDRLAQNLARIAPVGVLRVASSLKLTGAFSDGYKPGDQ